MAHRSSNQDMIISRCTLNSDTRVISEGSANNAWRLVLDYMKEAVSGDAWVYLTLQDRVLLGRWTGTHFEWPTAMEVCPRDVIEMVVFQSEVELRVTLIEEGIFGVRTLSEVTSERGNERYVEQQYLMYGEPYGSLLSNGWTLSRESMGGELLLPFNATKSRRVWCVVRDYFSIRPPRVISHSDCSVAVADWAPSDGLLFIDRRICGFRTEGQSGEFSEVKI
ncbi:hypothetical protein GX865_06945 [Candidatus Saccharibacteria bacterium]|nr:hypothetical protein [Candidatus Saccharibacteria bacterium]